jgi:L-lysine exporter family protein LysE/ArgO
MEKLFLEGLLLQASLIFALGAQNIFVLESGLRRENPLLVSFVCFICDLTLITLGVAGAASLLTSFPVAKIVIGLIGVFFLFTYGWGKIFNNSNEEFRAGEVSQRALSFKRSILLALTFSILNPHAYLDAFILIGGYSTKYDLLNERLMVGFGAAAFSGIWFVILSSASSYMKPFLSNSFYMKKVMASSGIILILLSGKLGADVFDWILQDITLQQTIQAAILYPQAPGQLFTTILY